ncbi:8105_t:CDS:2, partial [Funneliformis geosporum]
RFNHLYFISSFKNKLNNQQVKNWKENMVFSNKNYEEKFYWPTQKYTLSQSEFQKLKIYYSSLNLNITNNMISNIRIKYGHLRTADGHIISSE